MGLFGSGALKSFGNSIADLVAKLVGQDIVARSISLTQASGSIAVQLVDGARLKLGTGTTDYIVSNGSTTLVTAGSLQITANTIVDTIKGSGSTNMTFASSVGGITTANAMMNVYPQGAVDATDTLFNLLDGTPTSIFALRANGSIVLPTTDSSGTPGAATINQATGRSAIAAGASSAVITNSLVTAASHVFISPRTRDATGLLPLVTTIGAGSFTVTTSANCTAALVFDWLVIT